jgi:hypothetical protein
MRKPLHVFELSANCFYQVYLGLIYLYFPETKQRTLEEIAASFGDEVVEVDESQMVAQAIAVEEKIGTQQIENSSAAA